MPTFSDLPLGAWFKTRSGQTWRKTTTTRATFLHRCTDYRLSPYLPVTPLERVPLRDLPIGAKFRMRPDGLVFERGCYDGDWTDPVYPVTEPAPAQPTDADTIKALRRERAEIGRAPANPALVPIGDLQPGDEFGFAQAPGDRRRFVVRQEPHGTVWGYVGDSPLAGRFSATHDTKVRRV